MKETILVLCAHNDDQVIGAGGTLIKYAQQGATIKSIIFSFGESSHPHLQPQVIAKRRMDESIKADKIMGGSGVAYFGLREGKFAEQIKQKKIKEKLRLLIEREKPAKIFAHSINDPHPDHKVIAKLLIELLPDIDCEVYTFEVWTPFRLRNRYLPKLFVDVSETFFTKMKAIRAHESQKVAITNLFLSIYLRAKLHGIANTCKYAEVFDKLQ
ncbi:hypothetical protein GF342_02170 [Candidatus Woesearchaeota archaeon]|nr:hypothetical protein [Candidatus Woesearchaeota archaeon]